MNEYDYYTCELRNGDIKHFKELTDEELLDALNHHYVYQRNSLPNTTKGLIEYAAERGLIQILLEKDLK